MILLAVSMITLIIYALPHFSQIWVPVLLYLKFFVFWRGRGGERRSEMGENRKWVRMLVSYLLGVKISDLVPFTMSQTLVDHQRPSWYVLGCFSLNKIPEISIIRTILMIWLKHIDKGVFIIGIFQFFVFEMVLIRGRHQLLPLPHG